MNFTIEQINEIIKCANSTEYFAENYVKIIRVDTGAQLIQLSDFQKEVIRRYVTDESVIEEIAPRQSGKTTIAAIILLHQSIFSGNKTNVLLSPKMTMSNHILVTISTMYDMLPTFLQKYNPITKWNKNGIEFQNGCRILTTNNFDRLRGYSISNMYIDEFKYIQNKVMGELKASIYPVLCSNSHSKILALSSA